LFIFENLILFNLLMLVLKFPLENQKIEYSNLSYNLFNSSFIILLSIFTFSNNLNILN